MTYRMTWLASVLRDAGLHVVEEPGWQTRGHGNVGPIKGIVCHHTAGSKSGNMPSLGTVVHGRPGLDGPLCNLALGRDGTWFVVAAGRAYHAGVSSWKGQHALNSSMIGIEAEQTGYINPKSPMYEPWNPVEMDAYARGCAALMKYLHAPIDWLVGHKEVALPHGRKSDPTFDMAEFRDRVSAIMAEPEDETASTPSAD